MKLYEHKVIAAIRSSGIEAEHLSFEHSCHSAADAARAAGVELDDLVKNVCLIDDAGALVVAIVSGPDRVSTKRVAIALAAARPRTATAEEILAATGFPIGGVPSFGYAATYLVDPRVMERAFVYTGGGSDHALVRIRPSELVRANGAAVTRIRK